MADSHITLFSLNRIEDESGVSGVGTVAFGIEFPQPNGRAVLGWVTDVNSVAVYNSMDEIREIHGHGGKTELVQMNKIDVANV